MLDYIAKLTPACKDYIWGGTRLKDKYGKGVELDRVAEAWELSCHKNGQSVIANGKCSGMTLSEALGNEEFPLLVKLIDALDKLSIQVHPDDEYAAQFGALGKTEMWYVLDAQPGAQLVYGFNRDVTADQVKYLAENGGLEDILNYIPVKKGDVFFIPAGMVHAIGAGLFIAEIQQNSDTTYRLFDYKRVGKDGQLRPLHVDQALDVLNFKKTDYEGKALKKVSYEAYESELLAECKYFSTSKLTIRGKSDFTVENRWKGLLIVEGEGTICNGETELKIKEGDSLYIPENIEKFTLNGQFTALYYGE